MILSTSVCSYRVHQFKVLCISQVQVEATDFGIPVRATTHTVDVTVLRDKGELRFSSDNYQTQISENRDVGSTIYTVTAAPGVSQNFSSVGHLV